MHLGLLPRNVNFRGCIEHNQTETSIHPHSGTGVFPPGDGEIPDQSSWIIICIENVQYCGFIIPSFRGSRDVYKWTSLMICSIMGDVAVWSVLDLGWVLGRGGARGGWPRGLLLSLKGL